MDFYNHENNPTPAARKISDVTAHHPKTKAKVPQRLLTIVLLALLLISIVVAGTLFFLYRDAAQLANDPGKALNEQTKNLVSDLAELIVIDEPQDPAIATVKDIEALKKENPEFYKNGQNGHIIFIFPTRVILYDQEAHKIINIAPIVEDEDTTVTKPEGSQGSSK